MAKQHLGAAAICLALFQGLLSTPAFAEIREVVIVGTYRTPAGKLEDVVFETNAEYFGCRVQLPDLRLRLKRALLGYVETQGWLLESSRCAFRTKDGAIEEFDRQ